MVIELLSRLLYGSILGTLLIVVVWIAGRLLPRLSGPARAWLWWLVCLKFLLSLFSLPFFTVPVVPKVVEASLQKGVPVSASVSPLELPSTPARPDGDALKSVPVSAVPDALVSTQSEARSTTPTAPLIAPGVLLAVWLLGVGAAIGAQAMALVQLRRLMQTAVRQPCPLLEDAARRVGLRRIPHCWVTLSPIEPLLIGGRQPGILLSERDVQQLSGDELLSILTHECVHLRRGDLLLSLLPAFAQAIFWFWPPVYFAVREFELAREIACDQQTVTALAVTPHAYGQLLVKLSSQPSPLPVPRSTMALSAGFCHLKRRIEMLTVKPYRRALLAGLLLGAAALLPWRLTAAPPAVQKGRGVVLTLPNLDFSKGLTGWRKTALGSDTEPHPFYTLGIAPKETYRGQRVGYLQARDNIAQDPNGDGGVLRYDIDAATYRGKRLRWSGVVRPSGLKKKAFLFVASESDQALRFAVSPSLRPGTSDWIPVSCVINIPADADALSLGMRLEGGGLVYGSGFKLEAVGKDAPLSPVQVTSQEASLPPPSNLMFAEGLQPWWNDNPSHTAEDDYILSLAPKAGRTGNTAASLKARTATPRSYGTIAQNASVKPYRGKRIRLSTYLKTDNAKEVSLWYVLYDKDPQKTDGRNGDTSGAVLRGTQNWTRFNYTIDVSPTAETLSFGVSSSGAGTVWVDGFQIEELAANYR